jgi:predicted secreted protein
MAADDGFAVRLLREITSVYTVIALARDVSGPSLSADSIDVTTKDSANRVREFIAGLRDGGEVTANILYDPNNSTHQQCKTDLKAGTIANWKVEFGNTADYVIFPAQVTGFQVQGPMDDAMAADLTLKVAGDWTDTV